MAQKSDAFYLICNHWCFAYYIIERLVSLAECDSHPKNYTVV